MSECVHAFLHICRYMYMDVYVLNYTLNCGGDFRMSFCNARWYSRVYLLYMSSLYILFIHVLHVGVRMHLSMQTCIKDADEFMDRQQAFVCSCVLLLKPTCTQNCTCVLCMHKYRRAWYGYTQKPILTFVRTCIYHTCMCMQICLYACVTIGLRKYSCLYTYCKCMEIILLLF